MAVPDTMLLDWEKALVKEMASDDVDHMYVFEVVFEETEATEDYLDRIRMTGERVVILAKKADERREEIRRERQAEAYAEANYGDSRPECP